MIASDMRKRSLWFIFANGILLYAFLVVRLHVVVEKVQPQPRTTLSHNSSISKSNSTKANNGFSLMFDERARYIMEARNRNILIARKANVSSPRDLGLGFKDNPGDGRPSYGEIVDENGKLIRDVSDLLQFAVIGFGKCGCVIAVVICNRNL